MDYMFWIWLAVLVFSAAVELATREIVSIWFTFGAVIPFILAATNAVSWEWQLVIFILLSAAMILGLRTVTKKFLLRNIKEDTNLNSYIGNRYKMLTRADPETIGSLRINDVIWSAVAENGSTLESGETVEVVKVTGNKLIVKKVSEKD